MHIGVDIGSSAVRAAAAGPRQPAGRVQARVIEFSSGVFIDADGLLTGSDATAAAKDAPDYYLRDPLSVFGDGVVYRRGRETDDITILAALLTAAYQQAAADHDDEPALVLAHPANWASWRRDRLAQAATAAGLPTPTMLANPIAASTALLTRDDTAKSLHTSDRALVIDWGSSTLELSLLQRTPAGFTLIGEAFVYDDCGGDHLDDAFLSLCIGRLLPADRTLLDAAPHDGQDLAAYEDLWGQLRTEARTAKEALSTQRGYRLKIPAGLTSTQVSFTPADTRAITAPHVSTIISRTQELLKTNTIRPDQLTAIFLIGGSTKLTQLHRELRQHYDLPLATSRPPNHATATGAAEHTTTPQQPSAPEATSQIPVESSARQAIASEVSAISHSDASTIGDNEANEILTRAQTCEGQGDIKGAMAAYEMLLRMADQTFTPMAALSLGLLLEGDRRTDEAKDMYSKAIKTEIGAIRGPAALFLGILLQTDKDWMRALACFEMASRSNDNVSAPHAEYRAGHICQAAQLWEQARDYYGRAIARADSTYSPAAASALRSLPPQSCPHCEGQGTVTVRTIRRGKGVSGTKVLGALMTGGLSASVTGLSRKEVVTEARCSSCRRTWTLN